ncbi:helix-turn-helix transcriptional regulator [Rhodococcus sp. CSLK01-03]|uniref:Helix-turn-helix transcriptional regulator n=1 Tax=Rhodococcus indonesiensis TaxID=3055869 RepID=A0ABT7RU50_9NOCA|nr:helix-turn-helix transcriptional regulator [Rhodococcus indonesiensis]MDM7490739.1 helix-turn-helix transcriptional regulator [Rhodococcus indonesiensis]
MAANSDSTGETISLGVLIGRNARRLRQQAGIGLDELAQAARPYGVNWTVSRVSDIESGRTTPGIAVTITYAAALSLLSETDVALTDLVAGAASVELNDGLVVTASALRRILGGGSTALVPEDLPGIDLGEDTGERIAAAVTAAFTSAGNEIPPGSRLPARLNDAGRAAVGAAVRWETGLTDQRAARRMDMNTHEVTAWAMHLWGRPFGKERDRRAGENATAQDRGRATRQMMTELRAALAEEEEK